MYLYVRTYINALYIHNMNGNVDIIDTFFVAIVK